ncbi:MAG: GNAT family N-acetyltransferase [Hyphomicrobiales bacterium]|jgi:ribosomal protein S18 acetylase RimI-like enzyme
MPNTGGRADIFLRPFTNADIGPLGKLFGAARASMQLFDDPYTTGEHTAYIAGLAVGCAITVVENDGHLAGFISFARKPGEAIGEISHLFVHPDHQGKGLGPRLLDDAITRHGPPLHLWVFEANTRARALYESRGFVVTDRTDGSGNDEKLPDMRYDLPA